METIVEMIQAITVPQMGLELQWDCVEDEGKSAWFPVLHAIVEAPGWDHSRFSTTELTTLSTGMADKRLGALGIAQAVADRVHLPLYDDHDGEGGSTWIRKAALGPAVEYPVQWETEWWTDEGTACTDNGTQMVNATSGHAACLACNRELPSRFPQRPLSYRSSTTGQGTSWTSYSASTQTDVTTTRDLALAEAGCPSRIARALVTRRPSITALSLMLAFERAFDLSLDVLGPLARWRAGELSDPELDALLASQIENTRRWWDCPRALRELRQAGRSVAAFVRDQLRYGDHLSLISSICEAFDIRLSGAKLFVVKCEEDRVDNAELDRELDQLIRDSTSRR